MTRRSLSYSALFFLTVLVAGAASAAVGAPTALCSQVATSALAEPAGASRCLPGANPLDRRAPATLALGTDLSYIWNLRSTPDEFLSAPVGTLTMTPIGTPALSPSLFAMDFDNTATTLWAIDDAIDTLGTIDIATGVFTPIGPITGVPVGHNFTGLRFDTLDSDRVFVSTSGTGGSQLHTLNLATRVLTPIGTISATEIIIDIAVANNGNIYGHGISTDILMRIDRETGVGTSLGLTGVNSNFAQGMDFDASTDILYAWIYIGGGVNDLRTFDLSTGAATLVVAGVNRECEGAIKVAVPFIFLDGFETEDTSRWSSTAN